MPQPLISLQPIRPLIRCDISTSPTCLKFKILFFRLYFDRMDH